MPPSQPPRATALAPDLSERAERFAQTLAARGRAGCPTASLVALLRQHVLPFYQLGFDTRRRWQDSVRNVASQAQWLEAVFADMLEFAPVEGELPPPLVDELLRPLAPDALERVLEALEAGLDALWVPTTDGRTDG